MKGKLEAKKQAPNINSVQLFLLSAVSAMSLARHNDFHEILMDMQNGEYRFVFKEKIFTGISTDF